jgi:hypothetical protein
LAALSPAYVDLHLAIIMRRSGQHKSGRPLRAVAREDDLTGPSSHRNPQQPMPVY